MIETRKLPVVKASDIERMLEEGMSRKEIAEHYGIPTAILVRFIKNCPSLAGKKKAANPVKFIDDLTENTNITEDINDYLSYADKEIEENVENKNPIITY